MAHFFDDYSDDERPSYRTINSNPSDKKFPRYKANILTHLFEANND